MSALAVEGGSSEEGGLVEIGAGSSLKNGLRSSRSRRQHAGAVTGLYYPHS